MIGVANHASGEVWNRDEALTDQFGGQALRLFDSLGG